MPHSHPSYSPEDMDRAATGREIGTLVAMLLIRTHGDPTNALAILDDLEGLAAPQEDGELDAVPIAAQAIRDAVAQGVTPL